ncbi:hypothetical protein P3T76_009049 [Phytophthora citrophthora]|uniref:WLGC domain-containing protein n=1 Tax=Phytophthora citrophthora TaxID=4793 RepID=A0AAD9GIC5_9STRA|nr:hypothetical protein P3T76_009049 [Phytophthora citrophthora]
MQPSKTLVVMAALGLSIVAAGYLSVLVKMLLCTGKPRKPQLTYPSINKIDVLRKVETSLHESFSKVEASLHESRVISSTVALAVSLTRSDSSTSKRIKLGLKFVDLAMEVLLLHQMLESGSPIVLIIIFTLVVVGNALSCAAIMFIPYERAPLAEIFVDILFDFLIVVGLPMLVVFYCLSAFTFDRAKLAINIEIFPPGWFEQSASVIADPRETAVIYQALNTLRILSTLNLFTRIGVNLSFCFRLWQVVEFLQRPIKLHSSVYPKRSRFVVVLLALFAISLIIFVEESVRTSSLACRPHPQCAVNARRWTMLESGSLTQCPCLMLVDRDIAPKTYAEWLNPLDVTESVSQLASTGDLQTLQLTNRFLPVLPYELRRCSNLRHLSLEYTHTQTFPDWANEFTKLEFMHIESKFSSPMVTLPDDLFDDMSSLTYVHFGLFIPMVKLPSFEGLTNLKSLILAMFLLLEELPAFDNLHNLELLVLTGLPSINTLPELGSLKNLQSFGALDRGAWCCNGFLHNCDLSDDKCGVHPAWGTPAATCLPVEKQATESTLAIATKFSSSTCGPVLRSTDHTPTEEKMAVCKGTMYRQCNKSNETEAMCYNVRFMGIMCTPVRFLIEMRRRQIAEGVGDKSMTDAKMLLLLQNEIDQIVGRRLTRPENHTETRELLEHIKGVLQSTEDDDDRVVVSDNANAIRSLVNSVFGDSVGVRQDPFHVVQRFTEKIKGKMERKIVAQQLHEALYSIDGELRPPEEMAFRFETVLHNVNLADISCAIQEWTGSIDSNMKQIRRGDLYVDRNVFSEGGGSDVRVVSTSQLEGFHSALKKMLARSVSVEVGLQILDLFILKHNLKIGQALENSLQRAHEHSASIHELLSKQLAFIETRRLPQAEFFNSLCINELDYEAAIGFSGQEYSLLRQVRSEQQASGQSWADCVMVTTIMYNIVVSSNTNNCLNLRRRSFATLAFKIDGLSSHTSQDMQPSRRRNLFCLTQAEPRDDNSPREQELQIQLFNALRKMAGIRKRRQVFSMVYDFVCCICTGIYPKSQFVLLKRWDNLKHKANQGTNLKIKLKLNPELIANLRCTDIHKTRSEKILNHLPIAQAERLQWWFALVSAKPGRSGSFY